MAGSWEPIGEVMASGIHRNCKVQIVQKGTRAAEPRDQTK